jgi:hypothetical protein
MISGSQDKLKEISEKHGSNNQESVNGLKIIQHQSTPK